MEIDIGMLPSCVHKCVLCIRSGASASADASIKRCIVAGIMVQALLLVRFPQPGVHWAGRVAFVEDIEKLQSPQSIWVEVLRKLRKGGWHWILSSDVGGDHSLENVFKYLQKLAEEVDAASTRNLSAQNPSASDGHCEHRAASLAQAAAAASFAPSHRLGTPSIALASEKLSTANLASVQMHSHVKDVWRQQLNRLHQLLDRSDLVVS